MSTEELLGYVHDYLSDTSRSPEETKEGLEEVLDAIAMLLETLR